MKIVKRHIQNPHLKAILPPTKNRIAGYDLARAFSLFGMLMINYWVLFEDYNADPEWQVALLNIIQGRAAALFVVLAGIGISLLSRQAYLNKDAGAIQTIRRSMLKRALFLFIIGLLNRILWPADILHFYGIYFAIGVFLMTVPNLRLGILAILPIAAFFILSFLVGFDRSWDWEGNSLSDFLNVPGLISHLFFSGQYPVFPWLAFLMTGIWFGRQNVYNRSFRRRCLLAALGAFVSTETVSWMAFHISDVRLLGYNVADILPWIANIDPWEPMPLFVLSAIGTSLAVVILSILVAERFMNSLWLLAFSALGQLTLTLYVVHILLGLIVVFIMDMFEWRVTLFTLWGSGLFYMAGMIFAYQWKKHHERGPLEWAMRHFSKPKAAFAARHNQMGKVSNPSFSGSGLRWDTR
jgi:uncharacterized protein